MLFCKACGKQIDKDHLDLHVFMETRGQTIYESWTCADYCQECSDRIAATIVRFVPMIEQSCMVKDDNGVFIPSNDDLLLSVIREHITR